LSEQTKFSGMVPPILAPEKSLQTRVLRMDEKKGRKKKKNKL